MNIERTDWNKLKAEYLKQIQKVLDTADPQAVDQILEDVHEHLDQRYREIPERQRTPEAMRQIIAEMGPAGEYAHYLLPEKGPQRNKRKCILWILVGCILIIVCISAAVSTILTKPLIRPVVTQTQPIAFSDNVNPEVREISVTFSRPMMNFSWSWVGGGEHYPETTGDSSYDKDRKTCTLPVKLKPGQWYWIGINSEYYHYFQTEKHIPAKPYMILFATADENGNPTEIPADYLEEAERINSK